MMNTSLSLVELFFLLLLSPIMFNSITCTMNVQCNEKDKNTLLNFKQKLIDPSDMLSSWFTKHYECCEWFGVHCDNITGRVIELNLPCHTIPSTYTERDDKSNCLTGP
ncbi:putative non-specific serine/threonine protein kinase [Lupinus albus]|uniref:Putative non-specific serine/threonine protein kinase n=1 Tax=Lupinus albus TaxID=3870 RepID=A0A6A4NTA8_LUPAL|nr:putative non-specific serine/threonine protein kinase [Lupinus albus]